MEVQTAAAPDFVWQLLDWTSRGDVVIIEWQTTRNVNGARFDWRGVDKFRIRDGKIAEERVYSDTAPLRAFRSGENAGADHEILTSRSPCCCLVVAGLDPAIHLEKRASFPKVMDARVKPAHDEWRLGG